MSLIETYKMTDWSLRMKKKMQSPQEAYKYRNQPQEYFEWTQDLREDTKTYLYVLGKMLIYPGMNDWLISHHPEEYLKVVK